MPNDQLHPTNEGRSFSPDPTQRTIDNAQREIAQLERRMLDRLDGLEKAQEKFEATITRVPTEVDRAIKQLREFLDTRIDANSRLTEVQAKASEMAISKTERSVEDRLREMTVLFRSETGSTRAALQSDVASLNDKIMANVRRLDQLESRHIGTTEARASAQDSMKLWIAVFGVVLTAAVTFTGLVTFLNRPSPPPAEVRVLD